MAHGLRNARRIVLDVDGTVYSLSRSVGEIYALTLAEEGIEAAPAALDLSAKRVWRALLPEYLNEAQGYATDHGREERFWLVYASKVIEDAGVTLPSAAESARRVYQAFARGEYRHITPGLIDFLKIASAEGIQVYAASNNDQRVKRTLDELGVSCLFEGVLVAGDLGWKKPSRGYFDALSKRLEVSSGLCAHIGNDVELDVLAARRAGWMAWLFGGGAEDHETGFRIFAEVTRALQDKSSGS
jgi:hypothetical protein